MSVAEQRNLLLRLTYFVAVLLSIIEQRRKSLRRHQLTISRRVQDEIAKPVRTSVAFRQSDHHPVIASLNAAQVLGSVLRMLSRSCRKLQMGHVEMCDRLIPLFHKMQVDYNLLLSTSTLKRPSKRRSEYSPLLLCKIFRVNI